MFRRILVPLDGSARAARALPVAARLARASGGSVTLLRVVNSPIEFGWETMESPMQETLSTDQDRAAHYLAHIAASDELTGVETIAKVYTGAPAQAILSVARSEQVDLIALCSHGYTGMTRWALGSVAEKVASHALMPVLVLREGGPMLAGPHPDPTRPLRALVALDGSARAKEAIEPAAHLIAALAAPAQGALHLARVERPAIPGEKASETGNENAPLLDKAKEYLRSTQDHLRESLGVTYPPDRVPTVAELKLTITWSVALDSDVASALIRLAENGEDAEGSGVFGGCDLIVMATHGYGGFQHWAMGSITQRVLHATRLPLLIIRPQNIMDKSNIAWDWLALSAI